MTHLPRLILAVLFLSLSAPVYAEQSAALAEAMAAMREGDWQEAATEAKAGGQIASDIVEWHRLRAGRGSADEAQAFLARNSDWPGLAWLRRQSETAIAERPADEILAFFADHRPQTARGALALAEAMMEMGRVGEAEADLVVAWRTMPMPAAVQSRFLSRHGALLKPHHEARLDHMLWEDHHADARRLFDLVGEGHRKLALARIALHDMAPGVDAKIEAVPEALADDPGLAHARFTWRMRKGRLEDAKALLAERSDRASSLGLPAKWAKRRRGLARDEMRDGDFALAYRLAAQHFLTDGPDYADLEWLAGYIALRKLGDPEAAITHFRNFDAAVETPISKGRAGYWLGRAHEAAGDGEAANAAYAKGAEHQTTFYGLLAAERIGAPVDPALAGAAELADWRSAPFADDPVFLAGKLLYDAGETALGERFLTHLTESLSAAEAARLGDMALELGKPHLAVKIGKRAAQGGIVLPAPYFALHPVADLDLPMAREMVLAIARRESEFDPGVASGAGARGLMQVMPATAREVAASIGLADSHSAARLITDWAYNAQLGATYLAGLSARFDGNVVLMSAGYNAGPGRPLQWIDRFGDPRRADVDIVDWIEHVPFSETQNYIMRVSESLPVYRARLGLDPLPVPFTDELKGSTLRAFAPEGE